MKHLILFGIQGSGKGTQAAKIVKEFPAYKHIEMGDILRGLKGMDNHLGNYFKQIDQGKYVSDSVTTAIFDIFMSIMEKGEYMLMDGFPRTKQQMYLFMDRMFRSKMEFEVILLDIPKDISLQRLDQRQFYRKDGYVYHIRNRHDLEFATEHGYEIFHREDDNAAAVEKRLQQHIKLTLPVIEYFKELGLLHVVDATRTPEEIYEDIRKIITKA